MSPPAEPPQEVAVQRVIKDHAKRSRTRSTDTATEPPQEVTKAKRSRKSTETATEQPNDFPVQQVAKVVAGLVAEQLPGLLQDPKPTGNAASSDPIVMKPAGSAASAESLVMVPLTKQEDLVTMTRGQLQKIKDSLERTQRAASQCCSYFRAGAAAFEEEAKVIKDSLLAVDDVLVKTNIFRT